MTKEKRDSTKRRIILDLSWPLGASVNDGIPKEEYLGEPFKLTLPTADDLIHIIKQKGQGCFLFSIDLARAYRQLRSDPLDWPLLGFKWQKDIFFDASIPFGIRYRAMACQRTTNAVCYILGKDEHDLMCYIDDFVGVASTLPAAQQGFDHTRRVLQSLGLQEATDKASAPSTRMTWIGHMFDTEQMMVSMPINKIKETLQLCDVWSQKQHANRRQMQKLLGKQYHIGQCVKPARLFVGRMLSTLRATPATSQTPLNDDFKRDVEWFRRFLPDYNSVHIIGSTADTSIEIDSCLTSCGGISDTEYYHTTFPDVILAADHPICHLEMLNIVVAVKLWSHKWRNKTENNLRQHASHLCPHKRPEPRHTFLLSCTRDMVVLCQARLQPDPHALTWRPDVSSFLFKEAGKMTIEWRAAVPSIPYLLRNAAS